jgi:hypothetical protein
VKTTTTDDGVQHTVTPQHDSAYDRIVITHTADNPTRFTVRCYTNDTVYDAYSLEARSMSFKPVSLLGRGETDVLQGASLTDGDESDEGDEQSSSFSSAQAGLPDEGDDDSVTERGKLPEALKTAFESLGFAIVPRGRGWID